MFGVVVVLWLQDNAMTSLSVPQVPWEVALLMSVTYEWNPKFEVIAVDLSQQTAMVVLAVTVQVDLGKHQMSLCP
jgi:hypothetical protein